MAQSKQALRSRIKSVNNTKKITSAMEMIANAKLVRQRSRMEANREYAERLQQMVNEIVFRNPGLENALLYPNGSTGKFSIVFCSDLGLCGGYNQNILKLARTEMTKEDPVVLIGTSLYRLMKEEGFNLIHDEPISSDHLIFETLKPWIEEGEDRYLRNEVGCVQLLYTVFVNTMNFRASVDKLLPCEFVGELPDAHDGMHIETLFEPNADTILSSLIPMMIQDVAYSDWMESTTSEQGSRRMAMKTATDNADELGEKLLLEYNKARQAAITQEITEIVGGSDAV
ncbi:MAG: ATP synthase F1 subunit gamma [Solobacterium sp.]|nr:ATP synthase F1 subunit gamma [Solobacterium sp.]